MSNPKVDIISTPTSEKMVFTSVSTSDDLESFAIEVKAVPAGSRANRAFIGPVTIFGAPRELFSK